MRKHGSASTSTAPTVPTTTTTTALPAAASAANAALSSVAGVPPVSAPAPAAGVVGEVVHGGAVAVAVDIVVPPPAPPRTAVANIEGDSTGEEAGSGSDAQEDQLKVNGRRSKERGDEIAILAKEDKQEDKRDKEEDKGESKGNEQRAAKGMPGERNGEKDGGEDGGDVDGDDEEPLSRRAQKRREDEDVRKLLEEEGGDDLLEEGGGDGGDGGQTTAVAVSELDWLTGKPRDEDVIQFAVPVCGPYMSLRDYKYKVRFRCFFCFFALIEICRYFFGTGCLLLIVFFLEGHRTLVLSAV